MNAPAAMLMRAINRMIIPPVAMNNDDEYDDYDDDEEGDGD